MAGFAGGGNTAEGLNAALPDPSQPLLTTPQHV
jgi:hypothetical protein